MAKRNRRNRKNRSAHLALPAPDDAKRRPRVLVLEALSGASDAVEAAGGVAITAYPSVSAFARIDDESYDALLLTGGSDVDPRRYGERPHPKVYGVNETRDRVETYALAVARRLKIPVLGICRGAQIMNVEAGGTLRQNIEGHRGGRHVVYAVEGGTLATAAGAEMLAISLHHQAVRRPGRGFVVAAKSRTGTVEAIASRDGRCLGVQFHPEMDDRAGYARGIFGWLVAEAATRAGLPVPTTPTPRPKKVFSVTSEAELDAYWQRQLVPETLIGKATPKRRAAGQRTLPRAVPASERKAGVTYSWCCPGCGIRFDKPEDRDDHMIYLGHGSERAQELAMERRGVES